MGQNDVLGESGTLIKPNFPFLYLQMMVEKRTNQPKNGGCDSSKEKPSAKDKAEKGPVAANGNEDDGCEGRTLHEKNDETNHVPSHTVVTKPGPVNVSAIPAVEKSSPLASPCLGKLTYNPITHAPSMCDSFCTGSVQG